jgi:RNA-directed DNA polymerase
VRAREGRFDRSQPLRGPGSGALRVKPEESGLERSDLSAPCDTAPHPATAMGLWRQFLARENLAEALRRVERNAGAGGIDGMSTKELRPWLKDHWPRVRSALDAGTYRPSPVKRVMIPKPSGGQRMLGVPTVVDRLICQALLQVLTPVFDPYFHPHSFGFRPERSAHQAVERARQFIADGDAGWCVEVDLDSFFDRVCHDALMARVARRVKDKRVLRLIRRYLDAGVMDGGIVHVAGEGTPQGSPLSPLLSNVMLDDLDWELERRGHRFVRYADDSRIYVGSEHAGQRVLQSISSYVENRLKLKVNQGKSTVDWSVRQPWLGFCFYRRRGEIKVRLDPKAHKRVKDQIRRLTSRTWSVSMKRRIVEINRFTVGWTAYFAFADTPTPFIELDGWLRGRLRQARWKEWQRIRTRWSRLQALGLPDREAHVWAMTNKGSWRAARTFLRRALPDTYWAEQGLTGFADSYHRLRDTTRTAGCGPACPVVWEGPG